MRTKWKRKCRFCLRCQKCCLNFYHNSNYSHKDKIGQVYHTSFTAINKRITDDRLFLCGSHEIEGTRNYLKGQEIISMEDLVHLHPMSQLASASEFLQTAHRFIPWRCNCCIHYNFGKLESMIWWTIFNSLSWTFLHLNSEKGIEIMMFEIIPLYK